MKLLNPSIEQLVQEIVAVNHAWKEAKEIFNDSASPLVTSLRDLKTRLQIRLLRTYAPKQVYLAEDRETESEEPLYGLLLVNSIENWKDAAHIPVRVVKEHLLTEEIQRYIRFH
ncbi:hypothetical protein Sta7437_3822 [Stanieria cyanosphaera PCC 7437]|uniref:Uncharacterized protein n=1 Tax=Stanieria cyanosphaera (strain ATCC 29371 / PCC 7437) TaxID=111780 RepID=K9XZ45_STAC7|nr:hypothetical protein [Stanieria cyanosphaera]AFZ37309.1 hypothetical protein Sta7437_3822 [Stanieria cyanosphaera PCC 7437]